MIVEHGEISRKKDATEIFFSYSHEDQKLRDKLEIHLASLKNQGVIVGWHNRKVEGGQEWQGQIDEHLNRARVILLLVSAEFLASPYCYDIEVTRAIERHQEGSARVIPIILKPCDWQGAPFGSLQALPKDGKPITIWSNRDQAFTEIALGIKAAISHIQRASLQEAGNRIPSNSRSNSSKKSSVSPLTIAITGSMQLPPRRIVQRVRDTVSVYLGPQTLWYCGSVGDADEAAASLLLAASQRVVVVGYSSYDISDKMLMLLEKYQAPFVDAQEEVATSILEAPSRRDILFCTRSDLVILVWDGQSPGTRSLLEWLRQQRKDHLILYI